MLEVLQTETFERWLTKLRDERARARIELRLDRARLGNLGDTKPIEQGVHEMRINYGPGYRLYFMRRGFVTVVLLCGGDKRTQAADIKRAIALAKQWR